MKQIRVLMSSTVPLERNGITGVMINLYRNLDCTLFRVDFVSISEVSEEFRRELEGTGAKISIIHRHLYHPFRFICNYVKVCKNYDIVHVHGNSGTMALEMFAAWIAKVPVRIVHCHSSSCRYKVVDKIMRPVMNVCSNYRVACGEKSGDWLYKEKKYRILHNSVDAQKYSFSDEMRSSIRAELNMTDSIVIGHIGNFEPVKNHTFLLDVFEELLKSDSCTGIDFRLLLLGDGYLKDLMIQKTNELRIMSKVHFVGSVLEVQNYLSAMDIMVMPSLYEGVPLTLIEGQANGLPCIASDTISKEVDVTKTVIFYSLATDRKAWVSKIQQVIFSMDCLNSNHRKILSQKNIKTIKKSGFDSTDQAEQLKTFYMERLESAGYTNYESYFSKEK